MKVVALSAISAGLDLITRLLQTGARIDHIVALDSSSGRKGVSGYEHPSSRPYLARVPVTDVSNYPLGEAQEGEKLRAIEMDVLLVVGWQRLVPPWLISHVARGVLGIHGSSRGISGGRGRSPQNWALIMGAHSFEMAVFKIDAGVDSGAILGSRQFELTDHDDIVSSYRKTVIVGAEIIGDVLSNWDARLAAASLQDEEGVAYLPQRKDEDGAIDWTQSSEDVCRLVRALTRPYPGAHTKTARSPVRIWRARPIGCVPPDLEVACGTVIDAAADGTLVVRAGDGYVFVDEYEAQGPALRVGENFISTPMSDTLRAIAERHRLNSPGQPLSPDFERLMNGIE